ncbi:hypothetical protein JG687_00013939 [Phytophthora cactorum]|uniref:RxLR effector protein n=1 Tax=Phytophthora cactorum TaxID=29920 RepID=A0A329S8N2_9STRA|nr:hypothetical protein Pcac1_g16858 [Phytophthora cactorum]KAG2805697.1 hypothetical protein PC112_g18155 [Phytophthora cactorum]KAG2807193.1 hypothetical protein PC111_g17028 [Phytophthora cactorum]KAG2866220.1 hypothetical protein PC113_g2982 [Phytophthora cactorum]KAG2896089.1 hypothetical protein PC115_g17602 [Phytophthora cactorum]
MVKLSTIIAAATANVLILTRAAYAISSDYNVQNRASKAVRHQRFLRAEVAINTDNVTSLGNADEEDALSGKGTLAGDTPPSAAAGHDSCNHDGHDNPKDIKPENNKNPDKLHSFTNKDDIHYHHGASSPVTTMLETTQS